MLRIAICDDEQAVLELHERILQLYMKERGLTAEIVLCKSGDELLLRMESGGNFQIILLDVEMENVNGVRTAELLRRCDPYAVLLFVSGHDSYCRELMNVKPYAFFDKPLQKETLFPILDKAVAQEIDEGEVFSFFVGKAVHQIPIRDILYFESNLRKIQLVGRAHTDSFYGKMDEVEERLAKSRYRFLRIHKSFLVNAKAVERYRFDTMRMENGIELNISKSKQNEIKQYYMDSLL